MHEFRYDFYGHRIKALVLGRIRPELDYTSPGEVLEACPCIRHSVILQTQLLQISFSTSALP
jgi:hypothetical protein